MGYVQLIREANIINLCSQVVNNLKKILLILNNIFFKLP